jgi:lauroyl/myristoyl acyltransferase
VGNIMSVNRLSHMVDWLDYELFLPFMARLPVGAGFRLAHIRGRINARADREWRNYLAGHRHVMDAGTRALKMLVPDASDEEISRLACQRFETFSREEWETAGFCMNGRIHRFFSDAVMENVDCLKESARNGRGLVLLTCHFDSFTMGLLLLGLAGLYTNGMSSAVVEDERLPRAVRRFFFKKYRNMERFMGRPVVHQEHDRLFFYRALSRGDAVFMVGELPPSGPSASYVDVRFLGRQTRLASGPWRMAKKTGSLIGAFLCFCEGPGRYRVVCHSPVDPSTGDPSSVLAPLYDFFSDYIAKHPERWWASDLLTVYQQGE